MTESVERRGGAGFPANPLHWNETQLGAFLQSRGLPRSTARAFEDHLVNGLVAVDLSPEDLASMGICDDFQQRRLLLELRQLFTGGDDGLLSKLDAFLPEVQPQVPLKRPENSKARPVSPYLQGLGGKARRPKSKMATPEGRPEELGFSPARQATAAAASLAGGLHASDVQAAILAALPGALEAYLVPKLHPSVPSAPKHAPQKTRPGARRPGTGQAHWQVTPGWDRCRQVIACEARPFDETPAAQAGCNDEVAEEHGDSTADMEDEARALVPLLQTMHLPDDESKQGSISSARIEELEAQLQAMRASLQDATREKADLNRKLQASTDRCKDLERQLGSNQRQCNELLKELQEANELKEKQGATVDSLRADLLAHQQQLQQQSHQQGQQQQQQQQQQQVRETSSQCSLLAFTPSADTQTERLDSYSSPGQPPALPPRSRRDEADRSVGSSSGAEAVVGNLTASFEAAWLPRPSSLGGASRSSSQRQLDQICDEFRLQVRDLVATRPPRPQSSASADAIVIRSSAMVDETAKLEEASIEQAPIRIAASQEASFPDLPSHFVSATVAEVADSVLATEEQLFRQHDSN